LPTGVSAPSEPLYPAGADAQRSGLDALVGDGLAVLHLGAKEPLVRGDCLVEILDRDA
jgi:hypothetical protein